MRLINFKQMIVLIFLTLFCSHISFAEQKETIKKTIKFSDPSKAKKVIVDNIWGSIDVVGYGGKDVQLIVYKTIEGETKRAIERAKEEVELDITEINNEIELYVDGPFRDKDRNRYTRFS